MKSKKVLMAVVIVLIVSILTFNMSDVFAAINEEYYNDIVSSMEVDNSYVEHTTTTDMLLSALAQLVYSVGSVLEKIMGTVFKFMSGTNVFPWADAILFNAVPMLDINVFNPSGASIVAKLQTVLESTYWTIFSLALSFFGIAIMVTAIKVVVSTIASEKAIYKQAIMKWLMGFIMLWGIHFLISFAIYLNEQLVIEAQKITSKETEGVVLLIEQLANTDDEKLIVVEEFINAMLANNFSWGAAVSFGLAVIGVGFTIAKHVFTGGTLIVADLIILAAGVAGGYLMGEFSIEAQVALTSIRSGVDIEIMKLAKENKDGGKRDEIISILRENYKVAGELLNNPTYVTLLEQRVGFPLRHYSGSTQVVSDAGWISDAAPGLVKRYEGVSRADTIALLAFDTAAILRDYSENMKDFAQVTINMEADDGTTRSEKVDYLDFLVSYASTVEYMVARKPQNVVKREYIDANTELITYYKFEDNNPDAIKATCYATANQGKLCEDGMNMVAMLTSGTGNGVGNPAKVVNYDTTLYKHAKFIKKLADTYDPVNEEFTNGSRDGVNVIANLANLFKKMAWTRDEGWKATKVTVEGALLYATLVAQSLIFFIAYAKRLFYVIILILMAPVVVVFDFFNKFSS